MSKQSEIREKIQKIAKAGKQNSHFITAEVVSVEAESCTVMRNGLKLSDVRLGAVIDGNEKNLVITPKVGSVVLLCDLSNGEMRDLAVIAWSEVDSIVINGGEFGGLTKTKELKTQLDKLTARVDGIIDAIKSPNIVPVASDGGVVLLSLLRAEINLITDKESFSDIENEKIKH